MPGAKPVTSFENTRFYGKRGPNATGSMGRRGGGGSQATLTTAMTGTNNDLTLTARRVGTFGNGVALQIAGPTTFSHAGRLVRGGVPAAVTLSPSSGTDFRLIAKDGGSAGNNISITLTDPGGTNVTLLVTVTGKDINVRLDQDGSGLVTATASTIVAAINAHVAASLLVEAAITETNSGVSAALAKTNLAGGTDDPNLVYVLAKTDAAGAISMTGAQLMALLNSSEFVSATIAPGNDGTGVITALSRTLLAGAVTPGGIAGVTTFGDTINGSLESISGRTIGMSRLTFRKLTPKRQLSILTQRVTRANTIVKSKKWQEIQQNSPSTVRSTQLF